MSTILLVDDSPSDRALFRRILGHGGHMVHEVSLGSEVLAKIKQVKPHVVVLDVNLPDTNGHDVCRLIRASSLGSGIPVLMLTVRAHGDDVLAGLSAGADDYVAKDEMGEIILARVNRLANYRKLWAVAVLNEQLAQVGRLLAGIVHEIRSPLSVIRGHAELMQMTMGDNAEVQEFVEPILRNALLLQSRLDHLMAAVRTGPSMRNLVEVAPIVREAADLFEKSFDPRKKRARLAVVAAGTSTLVLVDPGRLMQVLLNLIANAQEAILEHKETGRIEISVRSDKTDNGDWVVIDVLDDGPGIPAAHISRIFEPFFTTKDEGTGYGLYLAHEIIREQNGTLTVRNGTEGGALFSIRLPLASEAAVASGEE